jgi:hypothetical protein
LDRRAIQSHVRGTCDLIIRFGRFFMSGASAGRLHCNEPEMRMLALFMLAIHAMCRALKDLLSGVDIQCRSRRIGMSAAIPGKSPDPILALALALHAGGAGRCRGGGEFGPAPAWFETG